MFKTPVIIHFISHETKLVSKKNKKKKYTFTKNNYAPQNQIHSHKVDSSFVYSQIKICYSLYLCYSW